MIKLELTPEEANGLLQLIDISIKAGGIANAKVGVPIFDKVMAAAQAPQTPAQPPAQPELPLES
jgi:hypothetical protein